MGHKENEDAIENLRSKNLVLSSVVRDALMDAVVKSGELINEAEDANDLLSAVKVLETATKMTGLSPKEVQANVQINAINGFTFLEIDADDIAQIETTEEYEEAEYEDG